MALVAFLLPLSAQLSISPSPSPLVFTSSPGQYDSRGLTLTNTGATAQSYSLLTQPPTLLDDLVSYYSFDNIHTDLLTNWTGAVSGTYFTNDRLNQEGHALGFDGINDYYEVWENNLVGTFSVSFRAKPLRNQAMAPEGYYSVPRYTDYLLWPDWYASGNEEGFGIALGNNGLMAITHADSYMPVLLSYSADLSGWNHYTLVFSEGTPKLYLNGNLVHTGLTSPRPTTYLSSLFGGVAYGCYEGMLDDLCIYSTALTEAQILASSQFIDMSRFRIERRTGLLEVGEASVTQVRMVDSTLPTGIHNDVITLCEMGTPPLLTPIPVVINVANDTVPLAPADITISVDANGNILLEWSAVPQTTHYKIYIGTEPNHPEYFSYLGNTTGTSYLYTSADRQGMNGSHKFFTVVAFLE